MRCGGRTLGGPAVTNLDLVDAAGRSRVTVQDGWFALDETPLDEVTNARVRGLVSQGLLRIDAPLVSPAADGRLFLAGELWLSTTNPLSS